jgi:hypothetical protein
VSHKIFGEDSRRKISKWKRRIETSVGMSVLPIRFICWIYQNCQFYRGRVGKPDKDSLDRPRAVTGLTNARHRSDRVRPTSTRGATVNGIHFLPLSFSLLYHFTRVTPPPNREEPPLLHSCTSLSPMEIWRFNKGKDSRLEAKGSSKAPLHFPLRVHWIQLEFFSPKVFKSSFCSIFLLGAKIWISLGRTSSEII